MDKSDFRRRLVRDQANKTLDIYLQRVRKFGQTLPDTILPPPGTGAGAASNSPRMGTTQTDTSGWTGWAISSFTNKIAAASGQMQAPSNGESRVASPEPRPNSVPAMTATTKPAIPAVVARGLQPQIASTKSASANSFASSNASQADEDDFDTGWGDDGAAWGADDPEADPFAPQPSASTSASGTAFDDKGEPDFAGWIASQSKQKAKNPLPKGLAKAGALRPTIGEKANSTGNAVRKKSVVVPQRPKVASVAKPPPKPTPKEDDIDDDAWGEAW
jgi:SCY1-like protein 1